MMPAPTIEMAIGRKIRVLANFSNRVRSTRNAYTRPTIVETSGTRMTQSRVLRRTMRYCGSVKIFA